MTYKEPHGYTPHRHPGPYIQPLNLTIHPLVAEQMRRRAKDEGYSYTDTFVVELLPGGHETNPTFSDLTINHDLLPPGNGSAHSSDLIAHLDEYIRLAHVHSVGLVHLLQAAKDEIELLRLKTQHLTDCEICQRLCDQTFSTKDRKKICYTCTQEGRA